MSSACCRPSSNATSRLICSKRINVFLTPNRFYARQGSPCNPPAANHQIVLVKHRRLPGRDGALRFVQFYFCPVPAERGHGRRRAGMVVTNLGRDFYWLRQMVERNPVAAVHGEFIAVEC